MINKILITIILISLAGVLAGVVFTVIPTTKSDGIIVLDIFLTVGQAAGIFLLLREGTLLKTIYWKVICFLLCLTIVGAMYKIMHWKFADIILLTSQLSIAITYFIRFIFKDKKSTLDILKVLWVTISFISIAFFLLHWISIDMLYVGNVFLWMAILCFVFVSVRDRKLSNF